ncbi:MAG: hypothetical protein H6713_11745 [Myxococcales bacterium]|nr:hypothetical protein [Myxococcales bacterium]MCB9750648.1 hypothetical protein [Myxococcales bacterium]
MRRARTVSIPLWRASRRKLTAFRTVAQRRSEARATTDELLEHVTRLHTREAVHPERGLAARTRALWSMERIGYAFARKARRLESLRDRRVSRATSPILHVGMGVCAAEFGELDPELTARIIEKLARPEDADFAYESFGAVFGVNERATQRWLIGLKPLPRAPLRELLPRFEPARQRLMAHGYGRLLYFQHATLAAAVEAARDTALDRGAAVQGIGFAYAMVNHAELTTALTTALADPADNEHFQTGLVYALMFWGWLFAGTLDDERHAPDDPLTTRAREALARAHAQGRLPAFALPGS